MPFAFDETELRRILTDAIAQGDGEAARTLMREAYGAAGSPMPPEATEAALAALLRVPLVADLTREELLQLVSELEFHVLEAGDVVVQEGDGGNSVFAVAYGHLDVVRDDPSQGRRLLASLGPGDFFGEIALVASVPRLASVVASGPAGLFELTDEALENLSATHPRVRERLVRTYRERLLSDVVAASPIFAALDEKARHEVAERFTVLVVAPGARLVREGAAGTGLHVVARGRCEVTGAGPQGTLRYPDLSEGDVFGEIALVRGTPATATVTAADASIIVSLSPAAFHEIIAASPPAYEAILALADERLARTTKMTVEQHAPLLARTF